VAQRRRRNLDAGPLARPGLRLRSLRPVHAGLLHRGLGGVQRPQPAQLPPHDLRPHRSRRRRPARHRHRGHDPPHLAGRPARRPQRKPQPGLQPVGGRLGDLCQRLLRRCAGGPDGGDPLLVPARHGQHRQRRDRRGARDSDPRRAFAPRDSAPSRGDLGTRPAPPDRRQESPADRPLDFASTPANSP
jgi:hypothetical protein